MPTKVRTPRLTAFGILAEVKKLLGVTTDEEVIPAVAALVGKGSKRGKHGDE